MKLSSQLKLTNCEFVLGATKDVFNGRSRDEAGTEQKNILTNEIILILLYIVLFMDMNAKTKHIYVADMEEKEREWEKHV
jgi:uncharacterized membrane protein